MKASIFIKCLFFLPMIIFADYMIMVLLGCVCSLFGAGDGFYCGPFCIVGKLVLVLSAIFFGYLIYPDIKTTIKHKTDGAATEK